MSRRSRLVAALLAALLLVLGASAAVADDAWELDARLADLGLTDPWTTLDEVRGGQGPGFVVGVLFHSGSPDRAGLDREVDLAARAVWGHAEGRVYRVLVQADAPTDWSGATLPEPVVLERADLQDRYGDRPAGLDAQGLGELASPPSLGPGALGWLGTGLVVAAFVVGAAMAWLVTFLFVRGRRAPGQRAPRTGTAVTGAAVAPPVPVPPAPVGWYGPPAGYGPPPGDGPPPGYGPPPYGPPGAPRRL